MSFEQFQQICEQNLCGSNYPLSSELVGNVVVYDAEIFSEAIQGFHQDSK